MTRPHHWTARLAQFDDWMFDYVTLYDDNTAYECSCGERLRNFDDEVATTQAARDHMLEHIRAGELDPPGASGPPSQ